MVRLSLSVRIRKNKNHKTIFKYHSQYGPAPKRAGGFAKIKELQTRINKSLLWKLNVELIACQSR